MNGWKVLCTVALVSAVALAGGEFGTGGSELMKFKGYNMLSFNLWGEEDAAPANGFRVVSEFSWNPTITDWMKAKVSLKYKSKSETGLFVLEDVYASMELADGFSIMGGQYKRPFGYGYTRSGSSMLFMDRPLFTDWSTFKQYGKRDIGLNACVAFDPVQFDLSYTNGRGANKDESIEDGKQFTVRGLIEPMDWLTFGAAFGIHNGGYESDSTSTWSSNGFDVYAVVDYPVSDDVDLNFVGEYMSLGSPQDDEGVTLNNGSAYTALLGAKFGLGDGLVTAIQPAVRYEMISPDYVGDTDPENDYGAIDFCLNLHMGSLNTLQLGGRNYTFEDDSTDSWTDMYLNWRMKF
jgi:hypothetical protein